MQVKLNQLIRFLILFPALILLINSTSVLWGQVTATDPVISNGREFMVPKKEMNGRPGDALMGIHHWTSLPSELSQTEVFVIDFGNNSS